MKTSAINTLLQYNTLLGGKTLHPLISIVDLSQTDSEQYKTHKTCFYSIILKEYDYNQFKYGRKNCDYSDATVLFFSPNDTIQINKCNEVSHGKMLVFHPTLISNSALGVNVEDYHFFFYNKNESLHLSMREKTVFIHCLEHIEEELLHATDQFSQMLITKSVELLLDYCNRFYNRQFILRNEQNIRLIKKLEKEINNYYTDSKTRKRDMPLYNDFATLLNLSPAYFSDLLKHETGHTWNEYIQLKRIKIAENWLQQSDKSIKEIATDLGYPSNEYFSRLFKKLTGLSPSEYRLPN